MLNKSTPQGSSYTSDERLYLNSDGKAVREGSPDKVSLLVAAGGSLTEAEARAAGLIDDEGNAIDLDAAAAEEPATEGEEPTAPPAAPSRTTKRSTGPSEDK